jgi:glucan phosphoethanolaminetransferase (alkaline phosphatase superfamily)
MTTRTLFGITLASALALAVAHYGQAMTIVSQGPDHTLWHWGVIAAYVFAIFAVVLVDRWWALLPAVVPIAVSFYLYNLTDYSTPWDSESIGNPSEPVSYAFLLLLGTALQMAVLSIGFIPRRVWRLSRGRTGAISQG